VIRPVRVLIAEDEAIIRMDLREMLAEEGHEVVGEARNGAEAIALARELRPDIIFMDVKMPGTGGLEAARAIGEERIAPPSCDKALWSLLGLSMAGWNVLISLALAAMGALATRKAYA